MFFYFTPIFQVDKILQNLTKPPLADFHVYFVKQPIVSIPGRVLRQIKSTFQASCYLNSSSYSFIACATKTLRGWLVVNHKHYDYAIKHSPSFRQCHSKIPMCYGRQNGKRKTSLNIQNMLIILCRRSW